VYGLPQGQEGMIWGYGVLVFLSWVGRDTLLNFLLVALACLIESWGGAALASLIESWG